MSDRIPKIKDALVQSRQHLNAAFEQIGDRLDTPVYSEGAAWNIHQIFIHLSVSENGLANQAMGIAEGREVIPPDFDLERWNRRSVEKQAEKTIEELRAELETARQQLMTWLDTIKDETVLDREGRFATLETYTVEQVLFQIANHEKTHVDDILKAFGSSE